MPKAYSLPGYAVTSRGAFVTPIDDPYRPDQPLAALFSVRRQPPLDNIFLAMDRMCILNEIAVFRESSERGDEALWVFDRKGERLEEPRLAAVVGMSGVQQVLNDFMSLDDGEMSVAKLHVVSSLSHDDAAARVGASGVGIRQEVADAYVVMRLAELVCEQRIGSVVESAVADFSGNGGCLALQKLAVAIVGVLEPIGPIRPRPRSAVSGAAA
jgi:hypothetical protein